MVEPWTFNPLVLGSSPNIPTKFKRTMGCSQGGKASGFESVIVGSSPSVPTSLLGRLEDEFFIIEIW